MADSSTHRGRRPRRPTRSPAQFQVAAKCREWAQVERLITLNASLGGLFLRSAKAPAVGTPLQLDIELPDGSQLSLGGTVVHAITPEMAVPLGTAPGFGVKLDPAHESDLVLLDSMARAEAAQGSAPPAGRAIATPVPRSSVVITSSGAPIAVARVGVPPSPEPELPDAPCTSDVVAGIDFGTSYSSIAVVRGAEAVLMHDAAGRTRVPSVVSYPEAGGVLVGWDARDRQAADPAHTVCAAKRLLGRRMSEPQLGDQMAQLPFRTLPGPGDQVVLELSGRPLSIPQVVAELFRLLRRTAERAAGAAIEEVVLTVPPSFEVSQRNALRKAAQLAGLRVIGMVDEPAAAALAYGYGQMRNEVVLVYDFGGGTFDCTIIDISKNVFRVLTAAGDAWLGGDDFDLQLAQEAASGFWRQHRIELHKRAVEWQQLLLACEAAKCALSESEEARVVVPHIARIASGPIDLEIEVTRARFQALCADLVARTLAIVEQALAGLGLDPETVGQVVLTGGVTRIPMVHAAVAKLFGRAIADLVHPDAAVALGAAVQAGLIARRRQARAAAAPA